MGLIALDHQTPSSNGTSHADHTQNMGAQAPISILEPVIRPTTAPEPYRPASATRLALRPNRFILTKVKHFCVAEEITLTHFFEKAALDYLAAHSNEYGRPGAQAPQIDRLLNRKEANLSSIARIFQFWTAAYNAHAQHHRMPWKPSWTDRDRTLERELQELPEPIIELGIITVLANKKLGGPRIQSFQYYHAEICANAEDLLLLTADVITFRLHYHRMKLAQHLRIECPAESQEFLRKEDHPHK